jgi:hypothetical protein
VQNADLIKAVIAEAKGEGVRREQRGAWEVGMTVQLYTDKEYANPQESSDQLGNYIQFICKAWILKFYLELSSTMELCHWLLLASSNNDYINNSFTSKIIYFSI